MRFPEFKNELFTKEEIKLLNDWQNSMIKIPGGNRIVKNMKEDPHVPEDIWIEFLKNLVRSMKEGDRGGDAVRKAITDDMLLKGPRVKKDNLPESLSKLIKVRSLLKYLKDNIPIFRDFRDQEKICKRINDGTITIQKSFKSVKLQEEKPVVWATFTEEVENLMIINDNINDLCDSLGYLDFNKCDFIVELRYESNKVRNPRIPTIIEAGLNPAFHPCAEGDGYGYTWDLKSRDWGLPEIVHEPISFHDIDAISYIGHKDKDSTSLF
jgi:hypothetical protein